MHILLNISRQIRTVIFIGIAKVMLLSSASLHAEIYAGVQMVRLDESIESMSFSNEPFDYANGNYPILLFRLGKDLSGSLAGEVRYGFGLSDHYISPDLQFEIDHIAGVYVRYQVPLQYQLYPYAISGLSYIQSNRSQSEPSDQGFSYGFGFDYHYSSSMIFNFEYLDYLDLQNSHLRSFGAGVAWKF